ncbi:MAG: ABC transporter permease [Leptospirillia bacterium]
MSDRATQSETLIEPYRPSLSIDFSELWAYRELIGQLVVRDISVRYKQSVLGILWVVLTPLIMAAIFSVIFGIWARMPSGEVPYPLYFLSGLVLLTLATGCLQGVSNSVVSQARLLTKVYYPRLITPLSATSVPLVDCFFAFLVLVALGFFYGFAPSPHLLWVAPLCVLWMWLAGLGLGTLFAALNVYYRDVGQVVPFISRIALFVSPVIYPISMIPEKWHLLYSLNPLVGAIETLRWALFGSPFPPATFFISMGLAVAALVIGLLYFRRMEHTFVDVV